MTSVTGRLISPSPSVLPGISFASLSPVVDPSADTVLLPFVRPAVVLSDGSFVIELPAGTYVVRITVGAKVLPALLVVPVDTLTLDIADALQFDAVPDPGGGDPGDPGDVTWSSIIGKPTTFPPSAHVHTIANVTSLQAALDGKAATAHSHAISAVTGLQGALDARALTTDLADGLDAAADALDALTTVVDGKQAAGSYATTAALTAVGDRVTAVEGMTPVVRSWNGSAYVEDADALIYVGPGDPGAAPDGSVWIDTTP